MQLNVLLVNVLSRASSTSTSVTFRFPSRESFSVMMSEGTSSLTVSPSSSDLASQHSHGKMTVSEPYREKETEEGYRAKTCTRDLICCACASEEIQWTECLVFVWGSAQWVTVLHHPHRSERRTSPPADQKQCCVSLVDVNSGGMVAKTNIYKSSETNIWDVYDGVINHLYSSWLVTCTAALSTSFSCLTL